MVPATTTYKVYDRHGTTSGLTLEHAQSIAARALEYGDTARIEPEPVRYVRGPRAAALRVRLSVRLRRTGTSWDESPDEKRPAGASAAARAYCFDCGADSAYFGPQGHACAMPWSNGSIDLTTIITTQAQVAHHRLCEAPHLENLRPRCDHVQKEIHMTAHYEMETHMAYLHDYKTGDAIRPATDAEEALSIEQAEHDGGAGVLGLDEATDEVYNDQTRPGRSVYVA